MVTNGVPELYFPSELFYDIMKRVWKGSYCKLYFPSELFYDIIRKRCDEE